jgi:hypothetical protein
VVTHIFNPLKKKTLPGLVYDPKILNETSLVYNHKKGFQYKKPYRANKERFKGEGEKHTIGGPFQALSQHVCKIYICKMYCI